MINQIEHNEVKSSQISENEIVGSKDSSGTIIHVLLLYYSIIPSLGLLYLKRTCIRYKIEEEDVGNMKVKDRNEKLKLS